MKNSTARSVIEFTTAVARSIATERSEIDCARQLEALQDSLFPGIDIDFSEAFAQRSQLEFLLRIFREVRVRTLNKSIGNHESTTWQDPFLRVLTRLENSLTLSLRSE